MFHAFFPYKCTVLSFVLLFPELQSRSSFERYEVDKDKWVRMADERVMALSLKKGGEKNQSKFLKPESPSD